MTMAAKNERGQSMLELIILFPLMALLVMWMFTAYRSIRAGTQAQKAVYFDLVNRLDNRPMAVLDGVGDNVANPTDQVLPTNNQYFMAVGARPLPQQEAQDNEFSVRIDSDAGPIATSNAGPGGRYGVRAGVCFYSTDKCN